MKTFEDVYKLPLKMMDKNYYTRIYDAKDNFVFQFLFYNNYEQAKIIIEAINGKKLLTNKDISFYNKLGKIYFKGPHNEQDVEIILIRGWGNLTGSGGMNLSHEEAANIQDTFAEYIVTQLNKRNNEEINR